MNIVTINRCLASLIYIKLTIVLTIRFKTLFLNLSISINANPACFKAFISINSFCPKTKN